MPDLAEFTRFIEGHHSSLRYFIQGLGVNTAWVDDIAQDTFLVAYRKWDEIGDLENPGAWLRAIARNLVLNETAKLHRRQRLMDENLTTILAGAYPEPPAAGDFIDLSQWQESLRLCLKELPAKARQIVEARYFRERTSNQIGAEFAMKPVAVRKLLFHARQTLGECLRSKSPEPAP